MKLSQHKISLEEWTALPQKKQLLNLSAELVRISSAAKLYDNNDPLTKESYERALDLVDLILGDPRWQDKSLEWRYFRDSLSSLYIGKADAATTTNFFSNWLLNLSQNM